MTIFVAYQKLTQQQKNSRRSLKRTIPISALSHDEVFLVVSLLSNWNASFDNEGKARLIEKKIKIAPFAFGTANYCQLMYKLENYVHPKKI